MNEGNNNNHINKEKEEVINKTTNVQYIDNKGVIINVFLGENFVNGKLLKSFNIDGKIAEALAALFKKEQENPMLPAPSPITYSLEHTFAGEGISKVADGVSKAQAVKLPRETLAEYREMLDRGLISREEYKQKVYLAIKNANQIGFKLNCYFWEKAKVQDFFIELFLTATKGLVTLRAKRLLSFYIEDRGYFVFGKLDKKEEENNDGINYLRREIELNPTKPKKGVRQPISYKNYTSAFKCEMSWRENYDAVPPDILRIGDIDANRGWFKNKSSSRSEITLRNKGGYFEIDFYMRVLPGDRKVESKRNKNLIRTFDLFKNYMLGSMNEIDITEASVPDPQEKKKRRFLEAKESEIVKDNSSIKENVVHQLLGAIVYTIDSSVGFKELTPRKRMKNKKTQGLLLVSPRGDDLNQECDNTRWRDLIDELALNNRMVLEAEAMLNGSGIVVVEADNLAKSFYIFERKKSSDTEYE